MTLDPGLTFPLVLAVIAGIVWLVRLEGRINNLEDRHKELAVHFWKLHGRIDGSKVYLFRDRNKAEGDGPGDD